MNISPILEKIDNIGEITKPVAVFGDYCLDKYLFIDPERDEPSLETGLTAYQVYSVKCYPGAAGTICNNLRALGAPVECIGYFGSDGEGYDLVKALQDIGADTSLMVKTEDMQTCCYIKPMRGNGDGTDTELNRLDIRDFRAPAREVEDALIENLKTAAENASAVIILDQFMQRDIGIMTGRVRTAVNEIAKQYGERGVLFFVDSRYHADEFRNMTVKCNNFEFMSLGSFPEGNPESEEEIKKRAGILNVQTGNTYFITRGSRGITAVDGNEATEVEAFHVEGPTDIVGAGDAASAGIVLGLVLGMTRAEAAKFACAVSSITIQQIGCTGTARAQQVKDRLTGRN